MKTVPTKASVAKFIAAVEDPQRCHECKALLAIMRRVTGKNPVLWGDSMVGFDSYRIDVQMVSRTRSFGRALRRERRR
jgi:hypothetical protein